MDIHPWMVPKVVSYSRFSVQPQCLCASVVNSFLAIFNHGGTETLRLHREELKLGSHWRPRSIALTVIRDYNPAIL